MENGVRLRAAVVKALELKEGADIGMHVAGMRERGIARKPDRGELLKRLRDFRDRLPADFKFGRISVGLAGIAAGI